MARQENTVAAGGTQNTAEGENRDAEPQPGGQRGRSLITTGTCEVTDRLQLQRLQDGFQRSHLQVDLPVDLHVVVVEVGFLSTGDTSSDVISPSHSHHNVLCVVALNATEGETKLHHWSTVSLLVVWCLFRSHGGAQAPPIVQDDTLLLIPHGFTF